MQAKEEKICSFQQKGSRLQLIRLITEWGDTPRDAFTQKFQVRLNRKVIDTSISEYQMRKLFATYAQNIVLQLKIY